MMDTPDPQLPDKTPDDVLNELHRLTQIPPGDESSMESEAAESWMRFAQLLNDADAGLAAPRLPVSPLEETPPRRLSVQQLVAVCAAACVLLLAAGIAAAVYVGQSSIVGSGGTRPQESAQRKPDATMRPLQRLASQGKHQGPVELPGETIGDAPHQAPAWDDSLQRQIIAAYDNPPASPRPQHREIEADLQELSSGIRSTMDAIRAGAL